MPRAKRVHPSRLGRYAAAGFPVTVLCVLLVACAPAADPSAGEADAPPPRITAEHPVTARPALEAGLLDGGATDGAPVLGGDDPVDGLGAGAGGAALAAVLPADDLAESRDFYAGLLGFDVISTEPDEPPFRRIDLARGEIRIVLLGPEGWEREMPGFGESPAAGGGAGGAGAADEPGGGGGEEAPADVSGAGAPAGSGGSGGPVLRLALGDLPGVAEALTGAGVEVEVGDRGQAGAGVPEGRRLGVVDPAGNRLLLVPAEGS